jgi:cold shock CspA family protein
MEKELLDFCRIKKIFDKGFGFLSSINYSQDAFLHFSKIKDDKIREELEKLKRGAVYIFYTSLAKDNKRKVARMWLSLKNVPTYLISEFKLKILNEFNEGKTNVFELTYVIKELRDLKYFNRNEFRLILKSKKVQSNPSVIKQMLNDDELGNFEDIDRYFNSMQDRKILDDVRIGEILAKTYN